MMVSLSKTTGRLLLVGIGIVIDAEWRLWRSGVYATNTSEACNRLCCLVIVDMG